MHWYDPIMHALMAELYPASHKLIYTDDRSISRQCPILQQIGVT